MRSASGQVLVMVALALPVFFGFTALVVDGSTLMVHKRSAQNAVDAVSLALSQNIQLTGGGGTCNNCQAVGLDYIQRNGIDPASLSPAWHQCNDPDHANPTDQNCFAYPYYKASDPLTPRYGQVEVRLTTSVSAIFAGAIGLVGPFKVSARSVGSYATSPITSTTTIPGTTIAGSTGFVTITGVTHTTTDPDTSLGGSGVGFAMSRSCTAIGYTGAGGKADPIPVGSFATNGGLSMSGNAPKKVTSLYFAESGRGGGASACPSPITNVPPGTCTAVSVWGDSGDSPNLCVKTLVDLNQNNTLPINWPIPPPILPSLKTGAGSTTYVASTDYPTKCADPGTSSINSSWPNTHPPGVYCVTGSGTTLTFSGGNPGPNLTGGDGYTFFALGGAKISTSGNTSSAKYYWPSVCGPRPDTLADPRPASFTCSAWGRTLWTNRGYDPQTLFFATSAAGDASNCAQNAICLNGQGGDMTGDIFAPNPLPAFPPGPSLTDSGAGVFIAGGGLSAGKGFIESWLLNLQGNTGTYQGTGAPIVIPGGTHTTTDPNTTVTNVFTGTTDPGSTNTTTVGTATTISLDE